MSQGIRIPGDRGSRQHGPLGLPRLLQGTGLMCLALVALLGFQRATPKEPVAKRQITFAYTTQPPEHPRPCRAGEGLIHQRGT